jgi:choline dehydrogenase-like flavoprotein
MRLLTTVPAGLIPLLADPKTNWQHVLSSTGVTGDRDIPSPRGRLIGGTSAVNGMVYSRGNAADYNHWAQLGNHGWSFDDVLAFFRRHEDFVEGENHWHGTGGELRVERILDRPPLTVAFLEAAAQAGFPVNRDHNGATQEGFGFHHLTQYNGERVTSARAFLDPVRNRRNLEVWPNTMALRIAFEGRRAIGLEVRTGRGMRLLQAKREVILCGGAINTPQLLLLSGLGDPNELKKVGIDIVAPLKGVGRNFQDHPSCVVMNRDRSRTSPAFTLSGFLRLGLSPFEYAIKRRGLFAGSVINGGGFVRSHSGLDLPDLKIDFMPLARPLGKVLPRMHGFNVFVWLLRPESRGQLSLRSSDPMERPLIEPNFFSSNRDMTTLVEGIRIIRKILSQSSFMKFYGGEILPGEGVIDEDMLLNYVRSNIATIYHPVGTCRMGPKDDIGAVVDEQLRVRSVENLRVADVSIMPSIISGNTNAPAMMIGERAADFILRTESRGSENKIITR